MPWLAHFFIPPTGCRLLLVSIIMGIYSLQQEDLVRCQLRSNARCSIIMTNQKDRFNVAGDNKLSSSFLSSHVSRTSSLTDRHRLLLDIIDSCLEIVDTGDDHDDTCVSVMMVVLDDHTKNTTTTEEEFLGETNHHDHHGHADAGYHSAITTDTTSTTMTASTTDLYSAGPHSEEMLGATADTTGSRGRLTTYDDHQHGLLLNTPDSRGIPTITTPTITTTTNIVPVVVRSTHTRRMGDETPRPRTTRRLVSSFLQQLEDDDGRSKQLLSSFKKEDEDERKF